MYALLADGATVEIRPATANDFDAVWRMHWPGPSLETWCGYATGPMSGFDNLVV